MSENKITIDITEESYAKVMEDDEFIRASECENLIDKIKIVVKKSKDFNDKDGKSKTGWNVFFVDGTRGAGKSTFLKTVAHRLTHNSNDKNGPSFCELAFIDPTQIETGQHILLSLLANLNCKVEDMVFKYREFSTSDQTVEKEYEEWRKKLKDIAGGINLLSSHEGDRKSVDEGYLDSIISLNRKIDNAKDGLSLHDGVRGLFEKAREILKIDVFLVAFDDVDTNFHRGWDVLEMIRRYGDIPGLVFLVTGDLQLYTHLVRDNQFQNFSDALIKNDKDRGDERVRMVDHLEQQYLLKIFPLGQRVHLAPLAELLETENARELFVAPGSDKKISIENGDELSLQKAVEQMLKEGLSLSGVDLSGQLKIYVDQFLKMSVRTVIQVMVRYNNSDKSLSQPAALAEAMRGAMLGSLYSQNVDAEALARGSFPKLVEAVFDTTLDGGDNDTGFYLRPQAESEALKACSFVLAAEVAKTCRNRPDRMIRYLLQGPGSVSLFTSAGELPKDAEGRRKFKDYMGIVREENSRHWAIRAPGVFSGNSLNSSNEINVGCGSLRVNKRRPDKFPSVLRLKNNYGKNFDFYCKTFVGYLKKDKSIKEVDSREILKEIMAMSCSNLEAKSPVSFVTIFPLLGAIEELLGLLPVDSDCESNEENMKDAINAILNKAMSGISVTAAPWINDKGNSTDVEDYGNEADEESDGREDDPSRDFLVEWISKWLKSLKVDDFGPSPLLLGKIWSRLFFGWANIASKNKSDLKNLKATLWKFMLLNVCCLLNAVLLEEYSFYASSDTESSHKKDAIKGLEWKNPSESPMVYFSNLEKIFSAYALEDKDDEFDVISFKKDFPLFYALSSCPLLIILQFIKPVLAYPTRTSERHGVIIKKIKSIFLASVLEKEGEEVDDDKLEVIDEIDESKLSYIWIAGLNEKKAAAAKKPAAKAAAKKPAAKEAADENPDA